ncbi:MAG: leucyl/phenylalanyl-tRNA--protein transferase [Spirochaetales bacterium]|nr:MAG: leucyl/phenylalanyl-tRNA--protein transferase [Spirochaetales bacterium]
MKFPWLDEDARFSFPDLEGATPEGIVASGGNLSPGMLISAYSQGIFPWFSQGEPILWWSPDPRCVLFPEDIHVSKSMNKIFNQNRFGFTMDTCFSRVIDLCQTTFRLGQNGTWITKDMRKAYVRFHELGYAHSMEVWQNGGLVGGLYGVALGSCFFGESMFSHVSNASKAGLVKLAAFLIMHNFSVIDCQVYTPHLASMGARSITRKAFISLLNNCTRQTTLRGPWASLLPDTP